MPEFGEMPEESPNRDRSGPAEPGADRIATHRSGKGAPGTAKTAQDSDSEPDSDQSSVTPAPPEGTLEVRSNIALSRCVEGATRDDARTGTWHVGHD